MPRYDYECQDCGYRGAFIVTISKTVLSGMYCPSCNVMDNECNSTFIRLFSPSKNFILRGKGWGKDNYNKPEKKKEDKDDSC